MPSSWNAEISVTKTSSGFESRTHRETGSPILPTTRVVLPEASKISPARVVVVVFPFVPVIATKAAGESLQATSRSVTASTPSLSASRSTGIVGGTPGLTTIRSNSPARPAGNCSPKTVSNRSPPYSARSFRSPAASGNSREIASGSLLSVNTTSDPFSSRSFAAAAPVRAAPITSTFFINTFRYEICCVRMYKDSGHSSK